MIGEKMLAPLSQPIRSYTKTNRDSLAHIFPRLAPPTLRIASFVNGQAKTLVLVFRHSQFLETALSVLPELGSRMFHTRCTP